MASNSTTAAMIEAYITLLLLPDMSWRIRNQHVLCTLRDAASDPGFWYSTQGAAVQDSCEAIASYIRNTDRVQVDAALVQCTSGKHWRVSGTYLYRIYDPEVVALGDTCTEGTAKQLIQIIKNCHERYHRD